MIIQIRTRGDNGKFKDANPYDFAQSALDRIEDGGWDWLRTQLGKFCLDKARSAAESPVRADAWIARYQAIRGIQ